MFLAEDQHRIPRFEMWHDWYLLLVYPLIHPNSQIFKTLGSLEVYFPCRIFGIVVVAGGNQSQIHDSQLGCEFDNKLWIMCSLPENVVLESWKYMCEKGLTRWGMEKKIIGRLLSP